MSLFEDGEAPEGPFWGFGNTPAWVNVGGDVRYLVLSQSAKISRHFLMQADFEAAFLPTKHVALVTTVGHYGEDLAFERRRHYLLLQQEHWYLRFGKFAVNYGILTDNHTQLNRQALGFGQGRETYNLELGLRYSRGELVLSKVYGRDTVFTLGKEVQYKAREGDGYAAKASYYVLPGLVFALSHQQIWAGPQRVRFDISASVAAGIEWVYFLGQLDYQDLDEGAGYAAVGVVPIRGTHVILQYEQAPGVRRYILAGKLLPYPHFEFMAQCGVVSPNPSGGFFCASIAHYNL